MVAGAGLALVALFLVVRLANGYGDPDPWRVQATAARTVMAPQQLPVGVLTALIGVPVFLFLLSRSPRGTP